MKNSGLDWIGTIPSNWKAVPLKVLFSFGKGLSITKADLVEEGCAVISYGQIHSKKNSGTSVSDELIRYIPSKLAYSQSRVKKGNFIFADTSEDLDGCGNCVYIDGDDDIYAGYHTIILRQKKQISDNKYFAYLFKTSCWRKQIRTEVNGVKLFSISQNILRRTSLIAPPLPEQKAIADFLDGKCAEIDGLLADLDAEIKTLTEYKKSIIAETVTRGLNPNAPMKSSGIPWAETIPTHWHLHPVYNYFSQRVHENIFGNEQNLLSLSFGKIIRKDINAVGGLLPASYNTYNIVEAGDIIIRPTDLQNDKRSLRTGLVTEHGIITSAYIALKPNSNIYSPYFHYLLHSYDIKKVFYNMGNGVRQGLNYSEFSRLMLFEPPIEEQKLIATYLDEKCSIIEQSIADKNTQIETLKSYKSSLIYEYVTGKKQVI